MLEVKKSAHQISELCLGEYYYHTICVARACHLAKHYDLQICHYGTKNQTPNSTVKKFHTY